jgi:outer membrane protein TolC
MKHIFSKLSLILLATVLSLGASAQQNLSLSEAVSYALRNHVNIKNAAIDIENSAARVNEIKAIGLPQVNGNIGYTNNLVVPRFFVPARTFDPNAKEGDVVAAKFGVNHSANAGISLSQLVFDGSYLLGLKAADVYKELSVKSHSISKEQVVENVTKAYHLVQVNEEQLSFLKSNLTRLDSLMRDTRAYNQQGFVEKLDVQRLEVQLNNLRTQVRNIERLQEVAMTLLKLQMGMPMTEAVVVSDKLADIKETALLPEFDSGFKYTDRMDYSVLQTQNRLAELNLKNKKVGYYPRVLLTGNYGYNAGRDAFGDIFSKEWFGSSAIGLVVQIPIFDGFSRKYQIIQAQNDLRKVKQSFTLLEQGIDIQRKQAEITLRNNWETLQENKKNMELAREIVRVTRVKYQQGVGSSLEIVNAEGSYKEAQTSYFQTLYALLVAKVDWQKANGKLVVN